MKTLLLAFFIAVFTFSVNAQSKSPLTYADALVKYKKMQRTGAVLSVIGGVTFAAGNIMYWKIYNDYRDSEPPAGKVKAYNHAMIGGIGIMSVGIPLWAVGKVKQRHIEIALVKFKGSDLVYGIGLNIRF